MKSWFGPMFAALANRNYRFTLSGHAVSTLGTWVQRVGQALLVLELTGSGTLLGLTVAMQGVPYLVLGVWGE